MRKIFYGLAIFFGLIIGGFFILDNFVLHGGLTAISSAVINPGDFTAHELAIEKMWGKDIFFWSITGPRHVSTTEKAILEGVTTKDVSVCPTHRDFDNFRCNYEMALLLEDKSLCIETNSNLRIFDPTICTTTIDAITSQDPSECEKIEKRDRDPCYQDLARILEDPRICEQMSNSKHRCYWNLAMSTGDEKLCELSPFTQACTAIVNRDDSICEEISERIEQSKCYYNIAILDRQPDLCDNIGEEQASVYCRAAANYCLERDCTFLAQRYT